MEVAPENILGSLYCTGIGVFLFCHSKNSGLLQSNATRKPNRRFPASSSSIRCIVSLCFLPVSSVVFLSVT